MFKIMYLFIGTVNVVSKRTQYYFKFETKLCHGFCIEERLEKTAVVWPFVNQLVPPKNWVGVCGPLPKTLSLFMTKTCEIPYPISDLTLKSKPSSDQTVNINVKGFC